MRVPTRKHRDLQFLNSGNSDELEDLGGHRATEPLPLVAIVGRPNVGKSTLFNRIVGRRQAIVHDQPGVTRDRLFAQAEWNGRAFAVVDTGGFETRLDDPLLASVVEQVRLAIDEADVIIFLTVAGETNHPADQEVLRLLRASRKPVLAAVNKCDNPTATHAAADFYRFGFARIFPVAALHGTGTADLLEAVLTELEKIKKTFKRSQRGGRRDSSRHCRTAKCRKIHAD